jgi:hypothetical protein
MAGGEKRSRLTKAKRLKDQPDVWILYTGDAAELYIQRPARQNTSTSTDYPEGWLVVFYTGNLAASFSHRSRLSRRNILSSPT